VNLLARLPTYNVSYQQLTVITKQAMQDYNDERDENTVKPDDLCKIFSFEPEDVKYQINEFLDNDLDKAIQRVMDYNCQDDLIFNICE